MTVLSLLVGTTVAATACAGKRAGAPPAGAQADKFLFERGTQELNDKRWLRAREYFRELVDNYPQSAFRPDAKLGLGDSYLGENTAESVVLAISEFREFLTFYPTNPRADYAQYKVGLAHHGRMLGPDRDQSETREAIKEFEAFLERYPNSPLKEEVNTKRREAKDRLSEAGYRVGLFYFRVRWYPGAIDRFRTVLKDDPQFTNRDAVYYYLAESLVRVDRKAEAVPYYQRLVEEFEQSEYLERAHKRIGELKDEATARKSGV